MSRWSTAAARVRTGDDPTRSKRPAAMGRARGAGPGPARDTRSSTRSCGTSRTSSGIAAKRARPLRVADMTGPRRPQAAGSCGRLAAHQPIGGWAPRPSQSGAASSRGPQAPRRQIVELHAGRLDREDRGQETEDQEHRDRDQERSPDGRDGDLARGCVHGCVHAGETPCRGMLFHAGIRKSDGNLVRGGRRTAVALLERMF